MKQLTEKAISVPVSTSVSADELLRTALDIAEHTLRCGGDVRRVEETIIRICAAFGATHTESFTITSVIVASVWMPDGTHSQQMRRVYGSSNNLEAFETYNSISRSICNGTMTLAEAREAVRKARQKKTYPSWVYYLGAILAAGSFAVFFGGSWQDGIAAGICGIVITFLNRHLGSNTNQIAITVLDSFVAGGVAILLVFLGIGLNVEKVMIGSIMLLIPGVAFSVSMQDLLGGDVLSGTLRFIQAVLLALSIALGFSVSMLVFPIGISAVQSASAAKWLFLFTGVLGTIGFSLLFSTRICHVPMAGIGGLIACAVYLFAAQWLELNVFSSNMLAATAAAVYSYVCATVRKAPRNIFIIACMIPLVPGSGLYYTMYYLIAHQTDMTLQYFSRTLETALGVSAGFALVTAFDRALVYLRQKYKMNNAK